VHFLALELVPGETLAERVAKGPVPVEEALVVCRQIAEGVEAAHEKGVIHRDLKPANVKVTPEGKVKILDFGLAKAFEAETPVTDISQSPTLTEEMTRAGVILGTAAYMSPEQAKGKAVDKRADIFAFGAVLYELLTGKRVFEGETITETLASILKSEPDWEKLPGGASWKIRDLLEGCLQKDAHERLHDIADVRIQIKRVLMEPAAVLPGQVTGMLPSARWLLAMAVGLVVLTSLAVWSLMRSPPPTGQALERFVISPPSTAPLNTTPLTDLTISPDGSRIVYRAEREGVMQLDVRHIGEFTPSPVPDTEGAEVPFFSPDGESLAFFADGQLKRISFIGGGATTLCELPGASASYMSGSWGSEDTIVFSVGSIFYSISAVGGTPERLAPMDPERGERAYLKPEILPGGKALLFTLAEGPRNFQIALLSLETGEQKILVKGGRDAHYASTGHLVYGLVTEGTLMAVPFDLERLEVTDDPVPILEGIRDISSSPHVDYSFSNNGTLVYLGGGWGTGTPVWVSRTGQVVEVLTAEPLVNPRYISLSPDAKKLAVVTGPTSEGDLWIHDLAGGPPYPLAFEGHNSRTVWTTGGKRVVFASNREGPANLFWIPSDGSTLDPEPLLRSPSSKFPSSWSSDKQELIFLQLNARREFDIMSYSIEGGQEPRLVVGTEFPYDVNLAGGAAALSPDGHWIAYWSGVTGKPEIWVRSYPGPGAPTRVSPNGGLEPVWSRDGSELFYLEDNKLMSARIETEPELRVQPPQVLFESSYELTNERYDVGPDGRFLMIQPGEQSSRQINVVLNWFVELKRLVPTN